MTGEIARRAWPCIAYRPGLASSPGRRPPQSWELTGRRRKSFGRLEGAGDIDEIVGCNLAVGDDGQGRHGGRARDALLAAPFRDGMDRIRVADRGQPLGQQFVVKALARHPRGEFHGSHEIPIMGTLSTGKIPALWIAIPAQIGFLRRNKNCPAAVAMANNLRKLRKLRGWSQAEAAAALATTVPQYGKLERGERRLSTIWIDRAAAAFGVNPGDVVEDRRKMVPVVGYVGAGAVIMPFADQDALDEVEAPPGAPAGVVCVEVRGDSMYPRYFDRERIFYIVQDRPPQDFLGQECVVQLADGRMFLKILRRGTRLGVFSLESWNAPMVENVVVEWAAPVRWTERRP